jgi:hypothetical protein
MSYYYVYLGIVYRLLLYCRTTKSQVNVSLLVPFPNVALVLVVNGDRILKIFRIVSFSWVKEWGLKFTLIMIFDYLASSDIRWLQV